MKCKNEKKIFFDTKNYFEFISKRKVKKKTINLKKKVSNMLVEKCITWKNKKTVNLTSSMKI